MTLRRRVLAGIMAVGWAKDASAGSPGPVATIDALYAEAPRPPSPRLLSRRLRALLGAEAAGRVARLDFEWRTGGQSLPSVSGFERRLVRQTADTARVEVSFYNFGQRRFRRFSLKRENGAWVVDDVLMVPENVALSQLLKPRT